MAPRDPKTRTSLIALAVAALAALASTSMAATAPARRQGVAPAAAMPALPSPQRPAGCTDDDSPEQKSAPANTNANANANAGAAATRGTPAPTGVDPRNARLNLLALVQAAIRRSNQVGAARLLAEAANSDIDEVRAANLPTINATAGIGAIDAGAVNAETTKGGQYTAGVNMSAPLWDGGRNNELTGWRTHLAEAARFGELSTQEQVALQTVSLALERSRYGVESQVYEQYARKMGCLVDALQIIVSADHGRTSELVQARKTQQQAELMRDQSLSQRRLAEVRLRRFIGDGAPVPGEGITSVMLETPPLPDLLTMAGRANEIQQLGSQADALDSYVRAVLDGQKPQLGWLVSLTKSAGSTNSRSLGGTVTINVPLFNPSSTYTVSSARKRAEAARLQVADALEARQSRMKEVHEQALHAMDRARHVVEILHNSDQVRNFTIQQWQQLGRRSLFDVMAAEADHYNMRVQYVDALYDTQQSNALLWSLGLGLAVHLE